MYRTTTENITLPNAKHYDIDFSLSCFIKWKQTTIESNGISSYDSRMCSIYERILFHLILCLCNFIADFKLLWSYSLVVHQTKCIYKWFIHLASIFRGEFFQNEFSYKFQPLPKWFSTVCLPLGQYFMCRFLKYSLNVAFCGSEVDTTLKYQQQQYPRMQNRGKNHEKAKAMRVNAFHFEWNKIQKKLKSRAGSSLKGRTESKE